MGGESYKCPECGKWFMTRGQLADHLRGKHGLSNFAIDGSGPTTHIVTKEDTQ